MKKLVYVAGPYRGDIKKNIENAEKKSIELIRQGFDVITPHKNTAGYEKYEDETITHKTWLDLGLNLLMRCDAIYIMENAEKSEGTQAEITFALKNSIPIIIDGKNMKNGEHIQTWFIRSETELNTKYLVTLKNGVFSCTCPAFTFKSKQCKHIRKVKMSIAGENQKNKLPGVIT